MISKFTNSLKTYAFIVAYAHILLFVTLFPLTSLILFCVFVPLAYITAVFCLIDHMFEQQGYGPLNDSMLLTANDMFLFPDLHHFAPDSPLDIDYDIGIH